MIRKTYAIWMEGYEAQGNSSEATFCGSYEGANFREACIKWAKDKEKREHFNEEKLTYWGCKLFNNEVDARKSFG